MTTPPRFLLFNGSDSPRLLWWSAMRWAAAMAAVAAVVAMADSRSVGGAGSKLRLPILPAPTLLVV